MAAIAIVALVPAGSVSAAPQNHHNASVACVAGVPILTVSATQTYTEWDIAIETDTGWQGSVAISAVGLPGSSVNVALPVAARGVRTQDGTGNPPIVQVVPNCVPASTTIPTSTPTVVAATTTSTSTSTSTSTTVARPLPTSPAPPTTVAELLPTTLLVELPPTTVGCERGRDVAEILVVCGSSTVRLPETGVDANFLVAVAVACLMLGCMGAMLRRP